MPTPRRLRGTVESLVQHSPETYTVTVRLEKKGPQFRPGQFLHFALDRYEPSAQWPESRVFSIANSPSNREAVTIAYSIKGRFTARMAADLMPGREIWVKLPYGVFYLEPPSGQETVLIAGGTGITPFVSFLELACEVGCPTPIRLFYGARTSELLLFRDLINDCCQRLEVFSHHLFAEGGPAEDGVLRGQLDLTRILADVNAPREAVYYLAGPPAMIENFRQGLVAGGTPDEHIVVDEWE